MESFEWCTFHLGQVAHATATPHILFDVTLGDDTLSKQFAGGDGGEEHV